MLDRYRGDARGWDDYAKAFRGLLRERGVERTLDPLMLDGACLLCSEHASHRCHRRIVAEYLDEHWGGIEIRHL